MNLENQWGKMRKPKRLTKDGSESKKETTMEYCGDGYNNKMKLHFV